MKTFALGDLHGAYRALLQCFERSGFDRDRDRLIVLGDVCDGYREVRQCIDELLKVKHCDLVIGNHDIWALDWALRGIAPDVWTNQGGKQTIASYGGERMPQTHIDFLKGGQLWLELGEQIFVHGGFDPDIPLPKNSAETLVWDRELLDRAWRKHKVDPQYRFGPYVDIFLGHTTTEMYHTLEPLHVCNVWDLDTGAGWSGKLTIMDVETREYWQSDLTSVLYGGTPGRL